MKRIFLKNKFNFKRINNKNVLIILLIVVELSLLVVAGVSYGNKNLDKYIVGSSTSSSDLFAVMIEDNNGNYQESTNSTFPGYEYFYNQTKSGCMSTNGKHIEDSLLYDQDKKKATVKVSETSMCYLYFDKYKSTTFADQLIDSGNLWQSNLEGDGYRYTGSGAVGTSTNPNNFICFGTTDKSTCTANQDKYMYRVIGVFADAKGDNHVKLIKYKQLGSTYAWNANYQTDVAWENSDMYKGLNGNYFLTNTTYDYLQNTTWSNKIENWTWSAVNTKSAEDKTNNTSYYKSSPKGIYLNEMHKASTGTLCINSDSGAINCNGGEWTTPSAKIGLMYASDYALSLGSSALALTTGTGANTELLKTGWMHQSNNDTTKSTYEWTLARVGTNVGRFTAWYVAIKGGVNSSLSVNISYGVRPVFYLTENVTALGAGSLENPFIITDDNAGSSKLKVSATVSGTNLYATITAGNGKPKKYCVNQKATINDCTWWSISDSNFTHNLGNSGSYYVHVTDDAGYIAHSSVIYKQPRYLTGILDLHEFGINDGSKRVIGSGTFTDKSTPSNFICFGTSDKDECINNKEKYLYRVIGLFGDTDFKLIKAYALMNKGYQWNNSSSGTQNLFNNSDIYQQLNNGTIFSALSYDYFENSTWSNLIISNREWATYNASDSSAHYNNPENYFQSVMSIPDIVSLDTAYYNPTGFLSGMYQGKYGLIKVSDYAYSLGDTTYTEGSYINSNNNRVLYLDSWIHYFTDDDINNYTNGQELTMDAGYYDDYETSVFSIAADGFVKSIKDTDLCYIRPTFFISKYTVITDDSEGTFDNPFVIIP